ncbi:hypothetical protein [Megasphaera lornae]|uniref:hypothetical protein n=2 Tax=Megasphaera TaxID=906 RepID=UPI0007910DCC|nr:MULTISPECIES: hypothetical protein [Megasphaera]KXB90310.1 hypothetical protein HMPREF3033_01485 [Veillonellaceae bacterium DNF00751]
MREKPNIYTIWQGKKKKADGFILLEVLIFFVLALFLISTMLTCSLQTIRYVRYGEVWEEMMRQRWVMNDTFYSELHNSIKTITEYSLLALYDGEREWRCHSISGGMYKWLSNHDDHPYIRGDWGRDVSSRVFVEPIDPEKKFFFKNKEMVDISMFYRDRDLKIYWPCHLIITPWCVEWRQTAEK